MAMVERRIDGRRQKTIVCPTRNVETPGACGPPKVMKTPIGAPTVTRMDFAVFESNRGVFGAGATDWLRVRMGPPGLSRLRYNLPDHREENSGAFLHSAWLAIARDGGRPDRREGLAALAGHRVRTP